MEDTTKPILQSKTVLGLLAVVLGALLPPIAARFGLTFTADDGSNLIDLVSKAVELAGTAFAFYGRIKATKKIG